jgi:hypothetical protein
MYIEKRQAFSHEPNTPNHDGMGIWYSPVSPGRSIKSIGVLISVIDGLRCQVVGSVSTLRFVLPLDHNWILSREAANKAGIASADVSQGI